MTTTNCCDEYRPWFLCSPPGIRRPRIDPLQGLRDMVASAVIVADALALEYVRSTGEKKDQLRERLIEASNAVADLDLELLRAEQREAARRAISAEEEAE